MKLTELIETGLATHLESIWTAIPAIVIKVDLTNMTCNIRPKVKLENPYTETLEELPILQDVPLAYPKTAGSVLLMPPEIGDIVLVLFSKYALDNLLKDKQTADHDDVRRFSIDDAIVISGLFTSVEAIPTIGSGEIMLYHKSGSCIKFSSDGNIEIKAKRIDFVKL